MRRKKPQIVELLNGFGQVIVRHELTPGHPKFGVITYIHNECDRTGSRGHHSTILKSSDLNIGVRLVDQ